MRSCRIILESECHADSGPGIWRVFSSGRRALAVWLATAFWCRERSLRGSSRRRNWDWFVFDCSGWKGEGRGILDGLLGISVVDGIRV